MLKEKVAVITVGVDFIGKEFVKVIVGNDGIAIITDINEKLGKKVKESLSKEIGTSNIDFFKLDITSKNSLNECISFLNKKYQRLNALVNNAYPRDKNCERHFFDIEYEDFIQNLGLNLGGYFTASQQFSKYFKNQGYGNIINISSIYGVVAPRFEVYDNTPMTMPVEYAAIKSGLINLTKYVVKYFKGMNIKVNTLSPSEIFDHQLEAFLAKYKDKCLNNGILDNSGLKDTLVYLLSDISKYVNGQKIVVDDGFSL
ncbi:oxidoreductase [Aliarcobacter butzleri]